MTLCELLARQLDGLASCSRIPIQQQETYGDKKDTIWIKLWKISMERQPFGSNGDSMSRKVPHWNTEELEISDKGNRRSTKDNEKAIWQEKMQFSRTKGWRQYVAGKQEYLFKSTLKEVG